MSLAQDIVLSGTGISFILLIVSKFVKAESAREQGIKHGKAITIFMRGKIGVVWEKIEDFLQSIGGAYFAGFMIGLNSDDNEKVDCKPNKESTGNGVAGAIILFVLLMFPTFAKAEKLMFKTGRFAIHVPFARVDTTYLYDFLEDDGDKASRWGGETPLFNVPIPFTNETGNIVIGATTDTINRGDPFIGFNKKVTKVVEQQFDLGIFAGKKTNKSDWMLGLKASLPLWGDQ